MNQNVGSTDKVVRTVLGALLGSVSLAALAGAVPLSGLTALLLGVASLVLLGTAAAGTCAIYSLLGVDTCPPTPEGPR